MNYIGSKFTLSSWIEIIIKNFVAQNLEDKIFCDLFAGTGVIGRTFKSQVKSVISNDLEYYSYVLNKNYIQNVQKLENTQELIEVLNRLPLRNDGLIYKHYCLGSGSQRQYFSDANGQKIDTIRMQIQRWYQTQKINEQMYYFLLASLLESADKVANTTSVYGAFLKKIKHLACQDFYLEPASFEITDNKHHVYNENANELIKKIDGDILYLDPPYNRRQYGANYHILNTICLYKAFTPYGKTGIREYNHSDYCKSTKVLSVFEELIKEANFRYIFVSYNHEGLMSQEQIKTLMARYGNYSLQKKEHPRFKAKRVGKNIKHLKTTDEYLHILEKA